MSPVVPQEGQDAADTSLRQGYVGQAAATTEEERAAAPADQLPPPDEKLVSRTEVGILKSLQCGIKDA